MTEKRFWILNTLTKYSGIKDGHKLLTFDEVVELLNALSDDNEQLKQELENVDRLIDDLGSEELRRQYEEIFKGDNNDKL